MALAEVECSAAYLEEARGRDDLAILCDPRPLPFNAGGNLHDSHMQPGARHAAAARSGQAAAGRNTSKIEYTDTDDVSREPASQTRGTGNLP